MKTTHTPGGQLGGFPSLASVVEQLRPLEDDLRAVAGDLFERIRTAPSVGVDLLGEALRAAALADEIRRAIDYCDN